MPRANVPDPAQTTTIPDMRPYFADGGPLSEIIPGYEHRPGQMRLSQHMAEAISTKQHLLAEAGTGCHAAGQGILMYDGHIQKVETIIAGDQLMGPDGKPRLVLETRRGLQEMVDIVPVKGQAWRVNLDHILTLVRTGKTTGRRRDCKAGEVIDISVRQWLQWSKKLKHLYKLFRGPVEVFGGEYQRLPIQPYHLGMLLGDGCLGPASVSVCKPDPEIRSACEEIAKAFGLRVRQAWRNETNPSYYLVRQDVYGGRTPNPLIRELKGLQLFGCTAEDKFIPHGYMVASRDDRLQLLAGLLDTDGAAAGKICKGYDYISKSKRLANDLAFVARSVGLAAYVKPAEKHCQNGGGGTYFRVSISGHCEEIPCRIPRKQVGPREQIKSVLRTGFSVKEIGEVEPYYGFMLDGDGRYLLDDFTVTHNTGKSAAYLMAIAATGVKAIVTTHTKALQQQLWEQEIPRLQRVFPSVTAAVLKGRSNFACLLGIDRVERGERQQDLFETRQAIEEYEQLIGWLSTDGLHGDLDQLPFSIGDELREKVTVDGYGCLGRKCPFVGRCYSQHAKEQASAAQIVIVNHSMFLLDLILGKAAGLLPKHPVVVLDEAHALEGVATDTFGIDLTAGRWRVIERKYGQLANELQARLRGTSFGELILDRVGSGESRTNELTSLAEAWYAVVTEKMQEAKVRSLEVLLHESLQRSGQALLDETVTLGKTLKAIAASLKTGPDEADAIDAERWLKLEALCDRTAVWLQTALQPSETDITPLVRYVERSEGRRTRTILKVKPIRVSDLLEEHLWDQRIVLATSATLATGKPAFGTGDAFMYWRERVGAHDGRSCVMESPFPFRTATRLYVPDPGAAFDPTQVKWTDSDGQSRYRERVCEAIIELLRVKRGGAFVLCTSFGMVRAVENAILDSLHEHHKLYVQGDAAPVELLRRFKADGSGILIGTRTFWEGVDVPGSALQMVIIDRLPFGVPDDPLWEARCKDVGESWFSDLALPTTLIALKQGVGRLMRSMDDFGVMAILDGRLRTRAYGKWLLSRLPPSPLVGDVKAVQQFFEARGT